MLSNGFDRPLRLRRKPSRLLATYLLLSHVLALLALCQSLAIPLLSHVLLLALWGASALYHGFRYWPHSYDRGQYLVWQAHGDWLGETSMPMQLRYAVVTGFFVLVCLQAGQQRVHRLYMRDQLDTATWRRLRVRLADVQPNARLSSGA